MPKMQDAFRQSLRLECIPVSGVRPQPDQPRYVAVRLDLQRIANCLGEGFPNDRSAEQGNDKKRESLDICDHPILEGECLPGGMQSPDI